MATRRPGEPIAREPQPPWRRPALIAIVVVLVAVGILTFIMIKIVPAFQKIFADFKTELPVPTLLLMKISYACVHYWFLIPGIPIAIWLFVKLLRKFNYGRVGWDLFTLKVPVFGQLVEKNIMARTTRSESGAPTPAEWLRTRFFWSSAS